MSTKREFSGTNSRGELSKKIISKKRKQDKLLRTIEKSKQESDEIINTAAISEERTSNIKSTLSIAIPGSILENAQSEELRTYLAGQIGRAACIFRIDEIVVYDDNRISDVQQVKKTRFDNEGKGIHRSCLQLARILQYLECPQYLRKFFFPLHNDLKYSGILNPLDAPHHLRQQNTFPYREGVVINKKTKDKNSSFVNIGLTSDILVRKALTPGLRVTVKIDNYKNQQELKKLKGSIVPPSEPQQATGVYWGYSVRLAHSISEIFTHSTYENGYDLTIGTSDRGTNINEIEDSSLKYNHAIIIFGGLKGLETAIETDEKLNIDDPKFLFDHYINSVPNQGSRTIRTEEALLISLAIMKTKVTPISPNTEFILNDSIAQSKDTGIKQSELVTSNNNADLSRFD